MSFIYEEWGTVIPEELQLNQFKDFARRFFEISKGNNKMMSWLG
jgi:hypothetical protein